MITNKIVELNQETSHIIGIYKEVYNKIATYINQNLKIKPKPIKFNTSKRKFLELLNLVIFSKMGFYIIHSTFKEADFAKKMQLGQYFTALLNLKS
jgi:hypothetical protein